jgi:hypothetical protein
MAYAAVRPALRIRVGATLVVAHDHVANASFTAGGPIDRIACYAPAGDHKGRPYKLGSANGVGLSGSVCARNTLSVIEISA